MPKFSVKKPLTVFVAVLAILVLGVVAYLKMTPDLMPNMDFPYVILVTTDPGASPETVEADITKPLEQSMATLDRIKNVTSSSMDSVSMVVLEFEDGVNMGHRQRGYPAEDQPAEGLLVRHRGRSLCAENEPLHAAGAGGGPVL